MKGRAEGRVPQPAFLDDEALLDLVRARLVQGYDREAMPNRLHLERGVDPADVHRALAAFDAERRAEQAEDLRAFSRAGAFALAGGAAVGGGVAVWGGMALAFVSGGAAAVAIAVVVLELRRRSRGTSA